jgi:hypothetical protein
MKKIILIEVLLLSSAFAGCLNLTVSAEDIKANENFITDSNRCFNAYDIPVSPPSSATSAIASISTKRAGEEFYLAIFKKPACVVDNVKYFKYYLIDNSTGEKIDGTEKSIDITKVDSLSFKVNNSYKNVSVKFEYDLVTAMPNVEWERVTCPYKEERFSKWDDFSRTAIKYTIQKLDSTVIRTSYNTIDELEEAENLKNEAIYQLANKKCYKPIVTIDTTTDTKIEYSTDNFAIRPDKIDGKFNTSTVKAGSVAFATLKVVNTNGDITTNYNASSTELEINGSAQYSFDINNGYTSRAQFLFLEPGTQTISIIDKNFALVDEDDTIESCRIFKGETSIDVISTSKYWAGRGTEEVENNPKTNNINVDIKQNTKKDLHFQKMNW